MLLEPRLYSSSIRALLAGVALALLAGCGATRKAPASGEGSDGAATLTESQLARLATLSPSSLPAPPPDTSNGWADDKAAARLGQKLFFDRSLSGRLLDGDNDGSANALGLKGDAQKVACAGCHLPQSGFSDTRTVRKQISLAAGWGRRRAPSLLDVGQSKLLMWDGRKDSLYSQIFGVIESAVEMNSSRLFAASQVFLNHREEYEALFGPMPPLDDKQRFPVLDATTTGCQKLDSSNACTTPMRGAPGDGAEYDGMTPDDQDAVTRVVVNVGKALGAYERLLSCGPSRFDSWMNGEKDALSDAERSGAALFVDRGRCITCHSGPFFSDERFHNVGLKAATVATVFLNPNDRGAGEGFSLLQSDPLNIQGKYSDGDDGRDPGAPDASVEGAFRTPRLRCVSLRPSFMHTAQLTSLGDVNTFFNRGGDAAGYPGTSEITHLGLTPSEVEDLTAFMNALDGPGPASELLSSP